MRSSSSEHELAHNSDGPGVSCAGAHAVPKCADDRVVSVECEHLRMRLDTLEQKLDLVLTTLTSARSTNQSPIEAQQQWPRGPSVPVENSHPRLNHYLVSRF